MVLGLLPQLAHSWPEASIWGTLGLSRVRGQGQDGGRKLLNVSCRGNGLCLLVCSLYVYFWHL